MADETQTRRAQFVRIGVPVIAGVLVILFVVQYFQNGLAIGRGALFFLVGAVVILAGSIVLGVRDARAARSLTAADDDDTPDE